MLLTRKLNRTHWTIILVVALISLIGTGLLLRYPSLTTPTSTTDPTTVAGWTGTGSAPALVEPPTPEIADDLKNMGDTHVWSNGIKVTVGKASKYTPSETAYAPGAYPRAVVWEMTVTNGSPVALNMATFDVRGTFNGSQMEGIQDVDQGVTGTPYFKLRPGATARYKIAVGVSAQPGELEIQVTPTETLPTMYFHQVI